MLKGLDPRLNADVLYALRDMGHGDVVILSDTNFPAGSIARETVLGELLRMDNLTAAEAAEAILSVLPLDTFVDDFAGRMEIVGAPDDIPAVQAEVQAAINAAEGRDGKLPFKITRKGQAARVTLQLEAIGSYSDTWPYRCKKRQRIVRDTAAFIVAKGGPDASITGYCEALFLLSTGDDQYLPLLRFLRTAKRSARLALILGTTATRESFSANTTCAPAIRACSRHCQRFAKTPKTGCTSVAGIIGTMPGRVT